jgi:hypothetical protein
MPNQRVQTGVAGQDFPARARGGVALEHNRNVFTQASKHRAILPYPTELLKY